MVLRGMARNLKDGALGLSFKALLNERFGEYGEAVDCKVDTRAGRIVLTARLHGEREPIVATLENYTLEEDGATYIVLGTFSSSRAWIGSLLNRLFGGHRYELPFMILKLL